MSVQEISSILLVRPPQRKAQELHELATFFQEQSFFAGIDLPVLQEICSALTLHQAPPGEVVLHAGELTDRMYLLLSGSCSVVRHSRREGFKPLPPQQLTPGQALCEASLLVAGRRSDVVVTAAAAAAPANGSGCSGGGGAVFAVLSRAAWSSLCTRAPLQPLCAQARTALLCCCARSLAGASSPGQRTLEQSDDLAAVLKQLPSLLLTPDPVLRAMSESAFLRQLPAGTILFEECTRAESEFVVLAGEVQVRRRRRRLALGRATSAAPRKAAQPRPVAAASAAVISGTGKTVREKIEDERKAREALKESLALTRDGLREPLVPPPLQQQQQQQPHLLKSVEGSRRWMSEFVDRARKGNAPTGGDDSLANQTAAAAAAAALADGSDPFAGPLSSNGNLSRAALAWRRAVIGVAPTRPLLRGTGGGDGVGGSGGGAAYSAAGGVARRYTDTAGIGEGFDAASADALLLEYARLKAEEAGQVTDVGNLLGGAGSREAYLRGIKEARSRRGYGYDYDEQQQQHRQPQAQEQRQDSANGTSSRGGEDCDDENAARDAVLDDNVGAAPAAVDPLVRLRFLDPTFQLTAKVVRFDEAAAQLARLVEERGWDGRSSSTSLDAAAAAEPTIQSVSTANDHDSTTNDPALGADSSDADPGSNTAVATAAVPGTKATRGSGSSPVSDADGAAAAAAAAASAVVTDPWDEHLTQLYGPDIGSVDAGHVAGELPEAALCRAAGFVAGGGGGGGSGGGSGAGVGGAAVAGLGTPLLRRADTAIAGALGSSVLVVSLESLRRGHEAARDDLVAGRLAVLTSLEPIRGLSDEHQAQLALAATVTSLDANQLIVRQGQPVDALYVVLEGEVRLLDDPMEGIAASAAALAGGSGAGAGGAGGSSAAALAASFRASGRSVSLNSTTFNRRAATTLAAADSAVAGAARLGLTAAAPTPPPAGSGGHGAIRVRRNVASLPALTLLGPGGSFGESVLGFPEDVLAAAAEAALAEVAQAADRKGDAGAESSSTDDDESASGAGGGAGGGGSGRRSSSATGFALGASAHVASGRNALYGSGGSNRSSGTNRSFRGERPPSSSTHFLASAVTARPCRLLVLSRSLLVKYGYLRTSLPPFAELRRETINGRRQQLKTGLQNLTGVTMGLVTVPPPQPLPQPQPPTAAGLPQAAGQAPTPGSDRGGGGGGGLARSPSLPHPRAPLLRPVEYLEQMGFKGLSNPRTAALLGAAHSPAGGSGGSTPDQPPDSKAGAGGGAAAVTSLALAERLRRLGLATGPGTDAGGSRPGSGSQPSSALWQFLESNGDLSPGEDCGPPPAAPPTTTTITPSSSATRCVPLVDRLGLGLIESGGGGAAGGAIGGADGHPAAFGGVGLEPAMLGGWGGGGGGAGDVLRAPPKPCVMRTSLTGFRQYGGSTATAVRQPNNGMRTSSSGLPLIPSTASTSNGGGGGTAARDGSSGGGSPFLSRRATFQGPSPLRTDFFAHEDMAAAGPADADSPRLRGTVSTPALPPTLLSPSALTLVTAAAAADATSPNGGGGGLGPRTSASTILPSLSGGGGGGGGGSRPDSPRSFLASLAADGGGAAATGAAAPLRSTLLHGGSASSFRMRVSYTGGAAVGQINGHFEPLPREPHLRESAPGSPSSQQQQQQQQPYPPHPQGTQLNMHPSGWAASLGVSPRSRFRNGASSKTVSQLEIMLGAADGAAAAAPSALAAASLSGRQAWRDAPEMRTSWDGVTARSGGGGSGGGAVAGGGTVISRGGTHAATALALAALAASQAPAGGQFLLVP